MNFKEIFIKSVIKFSIQAILLFFGFLGSVWIWKQQFRDNQKVNNRKEAISLLQETVNIINERDIKTRRLIGFFSKRWNNLSQEDDKAYYLTTEVYRDMIFFWNTNNLSLSAKIELVYGEKIRSEFEDITRQFAELNNFSIERKLLKNSVTSVISNANPESLDQFLEKLNQIGLNIRAMAENMNGAIAKNDIFN